MFELVKYKDLDSIYRPEMAAPVDGGTVPGAVLCRKKLKCSKYCKIVSSGTYGECGLLRRTNEPIISSLIICCDQPNVLCTNSSKKPHAS